MLVLRILAALTVCLGLAPAAALGDVLPRRDIVAERGFTTIRMTQSVTLPIGENDDPALKQEEALRSFYSLVGGTCRTVLDTIAETCEITSITFNFRSGAKAFRAENQRDSVQINGEVHMVVGLKPEVGPPSPENAARRKNSPAGRF